LTLDTKVFPAGADLAVQLASEVLQGLAQAADEGRFYLLGCPAGRSGTETYRALARAAGDSKAPVHRLVLVALDAYVDADRGHVPGDSPHSCFRYMREELVEPLERVPLDQVWIPDPADPGSFDDRIRDHGGVDLFLLASGSGDGHVGFNSPGAARDSLTRIVELPLSTRRDNLRTYPDFGTVDRVPTHGVTVGIATIADLSKRAVLMLPGKEKATAFRRVQNATGYDSDWPVTVIYECPRAGLYADEAAAGSAST
jgi:glucosamine-6-phosphate deaminase